MVLQVEIWMWWWIGEDIAGFGGMKNGRSVGFGGETGMEIWMGFVQNGWCVISVFGVFLVM